MESFTNFIRSMLPWFATPISRIVLLERTIYRPLWIDLVSRDISVDPKQIRNLGKRCLSFDLRSRLITQTIILAIRNLVFHFYFADGKNIGYIFQNIRGTIYTEIKESATSFFVSKKSHFYNNLRRNLIKFS